MLIPHTHHSLAYMEMRVVLSRVLWNFDLALEQDSLNWFETQKQYIVWDKGALNVRLTPVKRG